MSKFEILQTTEMLCVKFQTRSENHGEAKVTAQDTRVRWRTHNSALNTLHRELRETFFSATPDQESDQGEMALEANDLAFVRFKNLAYPLRWDREFTGYTLYIDYGTGGESNMDVKVCKLHKFDITPLDGSLVDIEFTISSAADISERFVGHMGLQQQKSIFLQLFGPNLVEGEVIDSTAGSGAPGTGPAAEAETPKAKGKSKAVQTATDAFVDAHAPGGDGVPATH